MAILFQITLLCFRLQRRTFRSFVTSNIDHLAAWLLDQGYKVRSPRFPGEFARLLLGESTVVLRRDGDVLLLGEWSFAADDLTPICEPAPAAACLFDPIDLGCEVPR